VPFSTDEVIQNSARLEVLRATGLLDAPPEEAFDRLTRLARRVLGVPAATISLIDSERQFVMSASVADELPGASREIPLRHSFCRHVVQAGTEIIADDVQEHLVLRDNESAAALGLRAYAGIPLCTEAGHVLGTFCAVDTKPRQWTADDLEIMRGIASSAVTELELRITARALADQRVRQNALLDHTTEMICAADVDGRITYVNAAWQRTLGYTLEEARAIRPVHLVVPEFRESYLVVARALRDGETVGFESVLRAKDGRRVVCGGRGWPHREDGKLVGTYAVYRDLTEQYRSEHVRERLMSTLEASPDFVSIVTCEGQLVYLNKAARTLIGLDGDADVSLVDLGSLRNSEEARRMIDEIIPVAMREGSWESESTLVDSEGRAVPVAQTVIAHPSTHPDKPPYFLSIVARDLRERVRAERSRIQGEERFRSAIDASLDSFFLFSPERDETGDIVEFRVDEANARACRVLKRERSDIVGRLCIDVFPYYKAAGRFELFTRVMETGISIEREVQVPDLRLGIEWIYLQIVKVNGGIAVTARDITWRKRTDAARERDRAFNASLLEHLSESIVACDASGTVTLYNRATRDFHGLSDIAPGSDPIGSSGELHEGDGVTPIAQDNTPLRRALRGEVVVNREVVVVRKDEPQRTLLASGHQFFDSQGRLLGAVVASRDVTTQKVAERALRDSEERFRSVVDSLGEGLCISNMDGVAIYANDRMEALTGYAPHELVGTLPAALLHDEDRALSARRRAERRTGVSSRYAVKAVHKNGSTIFLDVSAVPYRDSTGVIVGSIILVSDAGERRRWEKALLDAKEEAERANRAKSDFLSRASHELRTPLNSVIGFSGILLKNRGETLSEADLGYVERIRANGGHLLSLVNDILDLAKAEAGKMTIELSQTSAGELVHDVVATLEGRVLEKPVTLQAFVPVGLVPLHTDAAKLRQVLVNLVGNAIKFTDEGAVTVRVIANSANVPTSIVVEDTGCGIAAHELPGIFEAFEQAESARNSPETGTGLGLSIAKTFCELLGFELHVESEPGRGTRFIVEL
jgi:PAS domain S-box-containing protein